MTVTSKEVTCKLSKGRHFAIINTINKNHFIHKYLNILQKTVSVSEVIITQMWLKINVSEISIVKMLLLKITQHKSLNTRFVLI